jgi:hypothetical protein
VGTSFLEAVGGLAHFRYRNKLRFDETWGDNIVDKVPACLWPKIRIAYYVYSICLLALVTIAMAAAVLHRRVGPLARQ